MISCFEVVCGYCCVNGFRVEFDSVKGGGCWIGGYVGGIVSVV